MIPVFVLLIALRHYSKQVPDVTVDRVTLSSLLNVNSLPIVRPLLFDFMFI